MISPRLATVVLFVSELERSVQFYARMLGLEQTVRTETVALLVSAGGDQLYLRSVGVRAIHSLGGIGPQYVLWTAASAAHLADVEQLLRELPGQVVANENDGFRLVEARDPDGIPFVITFPGPDAQPRGEIIPRIYDW